MKHPLFFANIPRNRNGEAPLRNNNDYSNAPTVQNTHRSLYLPALLLVLGREVGEPGVRLQGGDELVDGRDDEMHAAQVRLEVHGLLAGGQLELLVEAHALVGQVGDGRDREHRAGEDWRI